MPFSMCGAPATFQRIMTTILQDLIGKTVYVYIDDISIYTTTFEEHIKVLHEVLKRLRKNGLFLKPKKPPMAPPPSESFGHATTLSGTHIPQSHISAIQD